MKKILDQKIKCGVRPFRFFNSLSKKLEDFMPKELNREKVNIYSCGPTVYDVAHIGNFRSYLFTDILVKSLCLAGYQVKSAMNITDVDDKTINAVFKKKVIPNLNDLTEYTQPFIQMFFEDIRQMNIRPASDYPKATEHINEMLQLIQYLLNKQAAYEKDGSLYFSIKKKDTYGKLSKLDLSKMKTGLRYNTDEYSKEDIRDFVLWKKERSEESLAWESPFGKGRPGWHLECSAMIHRLFDKQLDIHTGGIDLIFPHHENEIAQSETAFGGKLAKYWLHCEHLQVDGRKMSKSSNNFYTLRDLLKKGYHAMAIRYFLISVPYRQKINFTLAGLDAISQTIKGIWGTYNRFLMAKVQKDNSITNFASIDIICKEHEKKFLNYLKDDLNTAKTLAIFHDFLKQVNIWLDELSEGMPKAIKQRIYKSFQYYDSVLSILSCHNDLIKVKDVPLIILELLNKRNEARSDKNFLKADKLREEILKAGYEILDSKEKGGSQIRKIKI